MGGRAGRDVRLEEGNEEQGEGGREQAGEEGF